jgi:hypothetical protein
VRDVVAFDCVGARAERYAVAPTMTLELRTTAETRVEAIALRCQIRIEPNRRRYNALEGERLHDLFGTPDRWADTLKPLQLANLSVMVPSFTSETTVDLPLPLTYDMEIATTKYFQSLEDGVVPLLLLFSGTIFTSVEGRLRVEQIPWSKEATYPLPVKVWREAVDINFPNSAWLPLHRETLEKLWTYKTRNSLPTWESVLEALLKMEE